MKYKLFEKLSFDSGTINNITWLFIDKVLRMFVYLLILGKVASYLKAEGFGILNYAISLTGLFAPIVGLGLDNVVIKHLLADKKDDTTVILSTTFYAKLASSTIAFCLCITAGYYTFDIKSISFICILIISTSLFLIPFDVFEIYFQSQVKSKVPAIARLVIFISSSGTRFYYINEHKPIIYFAWLSLIEIFFSFLLIGLCFSKYGNFRFLNFKFFSLVKVKEMLSESWSLLISAISIAVYMKVDQVMLGRVSSIELGYYSAAVKLSEVWYVIPVIICSTLYPTLIKARSYLEEYYIQQIQSTFDLMLFIAIFICIFSYFFSSNLIYFIYGTEYYPSVQILKIHIWSTIFVFLGVISNYVLLIESKTKIILCSTFIGLVVNITLNLFLIPQFGGIGAAYATLFSQMTSVLSVVLFSKANANYFYGLFNFRKKIKHLFND